MDLTINGRRVTVDDSFRSLSREDQDATVEEIAHSMPKPEGSGVVAGAMHAIPEAIRAVKETGHQFLGTEAPAPSDPNYVPANLTNGSINPLKWNWSQAPQKVAEMAPGLAQDALSGTAAKGLASLASKNPKLAALAALVGAGASAWSRTAGDTVKETAAARTGNSDAEPEMQDKVRGGLTAAAAALPAAIPATRFIPGSNKVTSVGSEGALDAFKKYLATTAIGAGGAGASDVITQLGATGSVDPARAVEAAAGGGLTSGVMAAPRGAADAARAVSLREHGGENRAATENYATRLQAAAENGLGNSKGDYVAHSTVKTDLQNELRDAAKAVREQKPLSPEADNALQRAQDGKPLTESDIRLIDSHTAGAPDGANAAYLARTIRMAQLAEQRGSYDTKGAWSGGVSGIMDKNLGFLLNPARLAGGTIATAMGMHLLGTSNPMFAGSLAGGYGVARGLDSLTGMRSPAKTFAEHFADHNAQLRIPQTPQAPAPSAPPTAAPWGPRPPMAGPTGPQVAPPAAPAPKAPWSTPQIGELWAGPNPLAAKMLQQKLKAGLPAEPMPDPAAPPAPPPISPMALKMLAQKLKAGLPAEAPPVAPAAPPVEASPVASPSTAVPTDVLRNAKTIMGARAKVDAMKAEALTPAEEVKPKTIKKSNGKVESTASEEAAAAYEPLAEHQLYPKDITPEAYAMREAAEYGARSPTYLRKAEVSARSRIEAEAALVAKHPEYTHAIKGLVRQLHRIGSNKVDKKAAVELYASHMSPQAGADVRNAFK